MKKLLFVLSGFVLLSVFVLPSVLARKPKVAQQAPRLTSAKNTPPAPVRAQPAQPQQPATGPRAEAFTTAPGVPLDPKQLKETRPESLRAEADDEEEEEEAESAPESDIDPATLRRLKQQPWRAPLATPPYTVQQDGATKQARMSAGRQPLAPTQVRSFTGVGSNEQPDNALRRPPDPDMAAGPSHVVTAVNSMYAVYNKSGTRLQLSLLTSLYSSVCPTCRPFDPRVAYDPAANHWIILALHHNDSAHESNVLLAVSQTSDPTGAWWSYKLDAILNVNGEDTWSDYPDVGFDGITPENGGAVYITTNQFTFGTSSSRTAALMILPKSALYTGAALNYWRASDHRNADNSQAFTLRPAKTYGNSGVEYLVNTRNGGSFVSLWRVAPTYPPAAVDWTLQQTFSIGSYSPPPDATQSGDCGGTLDTIDNRIYNAVWRNNRLYAAFTEAHDWGGGGGTVAAVRYLKLNTTSNAAEINQVYGADGAHYYLPAIAVDSSDNIVLVFVRSGAGEFGSIRYTGRLTTDTTIQSSATLKDGVQCLTGARYGDYQGAAIDPADGSKVWVYGQWAANTGLGSVWDWGTWIGQVQFGAGPSCNYTIAPTSAGAPAGGTTGSITVTTTAGCAWTATPSATWLTITSGGAGNGNGTINYSVAANTGNISRSASISVADQIFTITQASGGCTPTTLNFGQTVNSALATTDCHATFRNSSYADPYTFNGSAGQQVTISMSSGNFDTYLYLLMPSGTLAASDDDGGGGTNSRIPTGSGFFTLPVTGTYTIEATSFDPNTIGNYSLTLTGQAACTFTITPTARTFTASGGSDLVGVTTQPGCPWTASNNGNTWITITSGASGTGSNPVNYTVAANPNTSPRTGTMTIAGQTYTITQDGVPCAYTLAPTSQFFTAAPATSSVGVTANNGCTWTAVSNSSFITINAGSSGNGNGTVNYSVTQNTTTSQRTGTMTIAGQTFTVTQAAVANSTCMPTAISFGQTTNGTLATSDCRATFRNSSYADRYTFNGIAGQQISISLSSVAYDTYLYLLAPAGIIAAADDDGVGGGSTNSRIPAVSGTFELPTTGTYVIEATTFNSDFTGAYTLTLDGTTPAATVQFSAPGYSFSEGATSAPIVVTRTGDTTGAATVAFATADNTAAVPCSTINGTAYARCDYATTVDTLTFAPGVTSKTINIPLIDDVYVEGNEPVQLTLANPAGATLGAQTTATLTITDNDAGSAANPIFASPFFVRQQYLDFLSREPDTPGFNAWFNLLNGCPDVNNIDPNSASAGCDRITVSSSFFGSQEFQLKGFYVFRFYKVALNRLPQYTEIVADMRSVTGSTAQEVFTKKAVFSNTFTQRPEFTNLYGPLSDANYVTALMGRYGLNAITTPDPAAPDGTNKVTLTTATLISQLSTATLTRAQVLRAIADSDQVNAQEFTNAFVGMQYYGYLRRTPDTPGFNAWFNYLTTHPTDFRTMVNGFMNSQEYRLRFGTP